MRSDDEESSSSSKEKSTTNSKEIKEEEEEVTTKESGTKTRSPKKQHDSVEEEDEEDEKTSPADVEEKKKKESETREDTDEENDKEENSTQESKQSTRIAASMANDSPPKNKNNSRHRKGASHTNGATAHSKASHASPNEIKAEQESENAKHPSSPLKSPAASVASPSTSPTSPKRTTSGGKTLKPFRTVATSVVMLDLETEKIVKVFTSMRQAEREMNVDRKHLRMALDPQEDGRPGVAFGYRWRLKKPTDDDEIAALPTQSKPPAPKQGKGGGRSLTSAIAKKVPKRPMPAASQRHQASAPVLSKRAKIALNASTTAHLEAWNRVANPLDMEMVTAAAKGRKRSRPKVGSTQDDNSGSEEYRVSDDDGDDDASHGSSSSGETHNDEAVDRQNELPSIKQGRLEFTLNGSLQSQLICELCMGYFREPYRITTCMHCFCKSCLLLALERAGHQCPSCQTYLGRLANSNEIPFKPDRLLHDLMDKVLFPELAKADEDAEADFYRSVGIQKKAEYREFKKKEPTDESGSNAEKTRMIPFQLVPASTTSTAASSSASSVGILQRPFLETESSLTVAQLKKYLQQQEEKTVTDLYCLGTVLGNEWSIDFVLKTIWKRRYVSEDKLLSLEYR